MCVAVPGRVLEIRSVDEGLIGLVELGTSVRQVNLALVPEAAIGDYVIAHSGIALRRLSAEAAAEALALWEDVAQATSEPS